MAHSAFNQAGYGGSASWSNNVMTAKASNAAVNIDDLLYMNGQGYVYPAQSTAWATNAAGSFNAAAVIVPETAISGSSSTPVCDVRQCLWVNPADQCIFILCGSTSAIPTIHKFSPAGILLTTINVDSSGASVASAFNLVQLSNGNLLATWGFNSPSQKFAIVDTDLNLVTAATVIPGPASGVQNWIHAIALKDGGFAVVITAATSGAYSVFFGVYSNTGAVVRASSAIPNTSLLQNGARCAQLSNGNIAVAINSSAVALGIAIFNTAGAAVLNYTAIDNAAGGGQLEISSLANSGFFCVGVETGAGTATFYVLNNAGALQGASLPVAQYANGPSPKFRIKNDGAYFWALYLTNAGVCTVARFPTTGASNAVRTDIPVSTYTFISDFILERDMIVFAQTSKFYVLALRVDGYVSLISQSTSATALFPSPDTHTLKAGGDFTMAVFTPPNGSVAARIRVWRYLDVAMLGVCQTTLAAGNKDALVRVAVGPSVQRINPLPGPAAGAFDSSSSRVVGNKGYLLQNSVSMKGY
jgi:hypothetical protein